MSSVFTGAHTVPNLRRVLLGTLYGLVDGAIAGCIFGSLYRASPDVERITTRPGRA